MPIEIKKISKYGKGWFKIMRLISRNEDTRYGLANLTILSKMIKYFPSVEKIRSSFDIYSGFVGLEMRELQSNHK